MKKCSIPKGTRDFLPNEMDRRNYILDIIREVFKVHAFKSIETPSLENLTTLTGKYGDEGDKLLFRVLNSGDFKKDVDFSEDYRKVATNICDRGLRYDLTVPLARFVVQHKDELVFPFRRYQIQPVWRADRPQKGRYREFYQCDADIIGSTSQLSEIELIQIVDSVFQKLDIDITLKINNRKVLSGIVDLIGASDKLIDITTTIDKLDKIGFENVCNELQNLGLTDDQILVISPIFKLSGSIEEKLKQLNDIFTSNNIDTNGVDELIELFNYIKIIQPKCNIDLDFTLARGLNYYTGAIFEVKADNVSIGSICGGGRYDNLTGIFGLPNISGVGISFGVDRIYDVLNELNKFPLQVNQSTKVMFINFGSDSLPYCIKTATELRKEGIVTLIYPDSIKIKKQLEYADKSNIPYVVFVGESEIIDNVLTVKNMITGDQTRMTIKELIQEI